MIDRHWHVKRIFGLGMIGAVLLAAIYTGCYFLPPISWLKTDIIMNAINLLAFFLAAIAATAVMHCYHKDESPYRIWLFFALGLWTWFCGELVWGIYFFSVDVVPFVTAADLFWVMAYGFFSIALYFQYRLIRPAEKKRVAAIMLGAWFLVVMISHIGAYISNGFSLGRGFFEQYLLMYYFACDLGITVTSLILVRAFGTGILMRPWLGLLIMLLADSFYTWLQRSNLYTYSAEGGNLLSLLADLSYLCACFAVALGCLAQYLLVKYGPEASSFIPLRPLLIKGGHRPRKSHRRVESR